MRHWDTRTRFALGCLLVALVCTGLTFYGGARRLPPNPTQLDVERYLSLEALFCLVPLLWAVGLFIGARQFACGEPVRRYLLIGVIALGIAALFFAIVYFLPVWLLSMFYI